MYFFCYLIFIIIFLFPVEFQNGSLRPEAAKNLQCGVYEHKLTKRRCVAVVDGTTSYKGQEDEDECCQTLIAIRNRKTNEVRLIAASKALMSPVIKRELISNTNTSTVREDLLELAKAFGSKKDRQRAEQQTKLKLSVDAVKDELEAVANQMVVKMEDLSAPEDTFLASLPPCNRSAKRDIHVYNLADMVSEEDIAELEEEAKRVYEADEQELESGFK